MRHPSLRYVWRDAVDQRAFSVMWVGAFIVLMDADLQRYVWRDAVDQRAFNVMWVGAFIVLMDADLQRYVWRDAVDQRAFIVLMDADLHTCSYLILHGKQAAHPFGWLGF